MKKEYEIAVLDIAKEEISKKLERLGTIFNSENYQKKYTYNMDTEFKGSFIKLRTNESKNYVSY